jgi:peptide/nickel transport system permease protein
MLFILSAALFALVNVAPGDPVTAMSGQRPRPQVRERLRRQLGLDQPLPVQYIVWLAGNDWMKIDADGDGVTDGYGQRKGILRGDFGFSYKTRKPVLDEILDRLGNTVYLMSITLIVVFVIAIPIGIISAVKQYSFFDISATTLSFMGQAIPEFWLGMILIIIFYSMLSNPITGAPLLPAGGMKTLGADFSIGDRLKYLILPVTMGAVGWVAWYSRFLRAGMLDVIHQDYIRTARAKGFSEKAVMLRHALKNALIPLVTIFALDIPYIFAGSLYVELMFSWPGMGRLYYQAATGRDYPLLMAILIIASAFTVFANLMADITYGFLDPRVRFD